MNIVISVCEVYALSDFMRICKDGGRCVVMHGKGTAVKSMLDILGIENSEKRIIVSVTNSDNAKLMVKRLKEELFVGVPGHGIVISVPVKSVGGGKTLAYLSRNDKYEKKAPDINYSYELIVAVANEGSVDTVMNAAREAGARGGTVIHGKGTGNEETSRFYNVSIAAEKETILIVSKSSQKEKIMQSIIKKAGPDTQAGAVVFSLPVSDVAGFGILD